MRERGITLSLNLPHFNVGGKNREVDNHTIMIYAYGFMSCVHRTLKTRVPVMEVMSHGSDTSGDADGGGKGYALEKVDESK